MRTIFAIVLILSLATAGLMFQLAGFDQALSGPDPSADLVSADELEPQANDSAINDGLNGSASTEGEGDIIGLIVTSIDSIFRLAGFIVLLPLELQNLGFPYWFAYPAGLTLQILGSVGLYQFASDKNWK